LKPVAGKRGERAKLAGLSKAAKPTPDGLFQLL